MHPLRPGDPEKLGAYVISGRLTDGPRGAAYLGKESDDAPLRVIKLLPSAPEAGTDDVARLTGVQRVSSSYVARTLEAGKHGDRPYVVREHVEGRSLAEVVAEDGPLDADALERVAVGVLTALTAVHLAGITHRGLTPHNVIIAPDGPRLTDIDLGEPAGEIGYRSPEQLRGLAYGPYADVFSWAATVVFAATGKPPFGQDEEAVLNGQPEVGNLGQPLRRVVLSALAKNVTPRPTTYMALLQLLGDKQGAAAGAMTHKLPSQPGAPIEGVPVQGVPPVEGVPVAGMPVEGAPPEAEQPMPPQPTWGPPTVPEGAQGPGRAMHGMPPMEGVPLPPSGPMWEPPREQARQAPLHGQTVPARAPRRFPMGLAAAVGALALLSAAGLWGANQYAGTQRFEQVAAADEAPVTDAAAAGGNGAENGVAQPGQPQPEQSQPEVTVPWANTPSADPDDVGPMVLPTDWTSQSPTPPELSTVPTPAPLVTQPVAQPTAQPTVQPTVQPTAQPTTAQPTVTVTVKEHKPKHSPTPSNVDTLGPESPTPSPSPTAEPTPTATVTPSPSPTAPAPPEQKPTQTAKPTPTQTAKPTPTRATTPTAAPKPTATSPARNPHSPTQVCGSGFYVQRSKAFPGGETFQLYNNVTGENCVVTMKTTDIGKATPVSVTLDVMSGGSKTASGIFEYYAGPVKLPAKGKCVKFSGSVGVTGTSADWANCG